MGTAATGSYTISPQLTCPALDPISGTSLSQVTPLDHDGALSSREGGGCIVIAACDCRWWLGLAARPSDGVPCPQSPVPLCLAECLGLSRLWDLVTELLGADASVWNLELRRHRGCVGCCWEILTAVSLGS